MSKPKFTVIHQVDQNNVGDMASNPLQYFLKPDEYQTVDITQLHSTPFNSSNPVIVGGGGLISNDFFGETLRTLLSGSDKSQLLNLFQMRWELTDPKNTEAHKEFLVKYQELISGTLRKLTLNTAPRYLWGAGYNGEVQKKNKSSFEYPIWIGEFDKVGVRDWNQSLTWAPCASCMHPALRKTYAVKNDVIWFEHKKQLIKDFGKDPIPRFVNSGDNIEQTIELLGSANIILTNSYHGAYWGTLLKKRVIVVNPWSSKFYAMRHSPAFMDYRNTHWKEVLDNTQLYPTALEECIAATTEFWNDINR